jgi:serine/threonine-protein kinase
MLKVGDLVDGKYKILNKVGQGGMSVVWLAINERANKNWAIKEVRKDGTDNYEVVKQSLVAETDILKRLHHPYLPSIVDIIDSKDTILIVMDFIEGNSLSYKLKKEGAQPQEEVVKWALQIADVLGYLHSRNPPIIYRDMKPANVMLRPSGDISIIDFGTARTFKQGRADDTVALGTKGYAAPEQYGVHQTDARTDVYCLGATMYHLVTGHNPNEPPYGIHPIRQFNPQLSSGLEEIILKCCQPAPDARYQSMAELSYALKHYRELDIEYKAARRKKTRAFGVSAIATLVFLLAALGFGIAQNVTTQSSYDSLISQGQNAYGQGIDAAAKFFTQAADLNPGRADAYNALLDLAKQDQSISSDEDTLLRTMEGGSNSTGSQNIDVFKASDPSGYAQFAYNLGIAYAFTYAGGLDAGQQKAQSWLADAAASNTLTSQQQTIASKLSTMSQHYESIFASNGSLGTLLNSDNYDASQFWSDLTSLIDDQSLAQADNSYVSISLYSYLATVVQTHYADFITAGVSANQLSQGLDDCESGVKAVVVTTSAERQRVQNVLSTIDSARQNIQSATTHSANGQSTGATKSLGSSSSNSGSGGAS